ncbi:methyltransferase-like protein 23 isoform X2 [Lingula anatina]|uniref:Methyltransferase-like protein 23 isoform X2 n=1 Tax=Lingula anatina TaxID=7574 RepID=A0A1S3HE77_LINAN|nr:methyltransferase-like protein 23 isoform X2 [Lingula anatina]|eukprot:XP_013384377.1 methyltransferase-like protein 23 isoform X2 [Lingula anatina]
MADMCVEQFAQEKLFHFQDIRTREQLSVKIPQVLDPSYGMYVWPCSPVLAQYIWFHRSKLGAGTALPGLVAALCGAADVTLSDNSEFSNCLENCAKSRDANGAKNVHIVGITWGQFSPSLLQLKQVDIVLASDCFYDTKDFEDVIVTMSFLMERNPEAEIWCTYQERSADRSIEHLLQRWQLECTHIPLGTFEADSPDIGQSGLPGNHTIHMLILKKTKPG